MPARVRLSLQRSRTRRRVLLALVSLGEGYVGQIAAVARVQRVRVKAVLVGAPPAFAADLSMERVGLAEGAWDGRGFVWRPTPRALREARRLTTRWRAVSGKQWKTEE